MANNYLQFSVQLNFKYDSEKEWWNKALSVDLEEAMDEDGSYPDIKEVNLARKIISDPDSFGYSFQYEIEPDGVWFYADEYGDPYEVAALVYEFFKEMRPDGDDEFVITWAETCSKMRLDEFGGGMILATKRGIGVCDYTAQYDCCKLSVSSPYGEICSTEKPYVRFGTLGKSAHVTCCDKKMGTTEVKGGGDKGA